MENEILEEFLMRDKVFHVLDDRRRLTLIEIFELGVGLVEKFGDLGDREVERFLQFDRRSETLRGDFTYGLTLTLTLI